MLLRYKSELRQKFCTPAGYCLISHFLAGSPKKAAYFRLKFGRPFRRFFIFGFFGQALTRLAAVSSAVVITLGEKGLIWQRGQECGTVPAFPVTTIDTTGAGDAFHGAFAAAVAAKMDWLEVLYVMRAPPERYAVRKQAHVQGFLHRKSTGLYMKAGNKPDNNRIFYQSSGFN